MPVGSIHLLTESGWYTKIQRNDFRIAQQAVRNLFITLVVLLMLAISATATSAPPDEPSVDTTIIIDLKLNGQARGEIESVRTSDGNFWIRAQDLAAFGITPSASASERTIGGVLHISLQSLGAQSISFDERSLSLSAILPAELFPVETTTQYKQSFAVTASDSPFSSFFNYRAAASRGDTIDSQQYTLAAEAGFRIAGLLFRHDASWVRTMNNTNSTRLATQAIYDDTQHLNRWTLGDSIATSGTLGSNFPLVGINLTRLFSINPSFVRQPLAAFGGSALLPSQIEVLSSGIPIFRGDVKPGPYELRDLFYASGARNIDVRVRDALGRVETITFPFYFADGLLAKGLSEYSFSFGQRRDTPLLFDASQSRLVAMGFYRVGVTDFITGGLRGEASRDLWNAGPTIAAKSDRFGVVELAYSASKRNGNASNGSASSFSYTYASPILTSRFTSLHYTDSYTNLISLQADARALRSQRLDFTTGNRFFGSFSLSLGTTTFANRSYERASTIGWNRSLFSRLQVFATLGKIRGDRQENRVYIGLNYNLNADENVLTTAQKSGDGSSESVQFLRTVPQGEGLGYRVEVERASELVGKQLRVAPFLQYNFQAISVAFNALDQISSNGGRSRNTEISLAGGIGCVMTSCLPSRTIGDSFAIVELGAPIPDVKILRNNQNAGKTSASGTLILGDLGSYYETEIRLNDRDIPIEYGFKLASQRISPAFRSGSRINFGVRRIFNVYGKLAQNLGKRELLLKNYLAVLTHNDHRRIISTEDDGTFYLEEMEPGTYNGEAVIDGAVCKFDLLVPDIEGITYDVKDTIICH